MDIYENYLGFLDDLMKWGDDSRTQRCRVSPLENLRSLLRKSSRSADRDVFSPFLYVALSAGLKLEDMLLLAAALYMGQCGEPLTPAAWKLFCTGTGNDFPATELLGQPSRLLYEREWDETGLPSRIWIAPQLFPFLCGNIPDIRHLPGMDWYHPAEEPLSFLGENIRLYEKIDVCLRQIPGKKLVYLKGRKGSGRKLNYAYLAAASHMSLAVISCETLQTERQLLEMQRECLLHHAMYAIELSDDTDGLAPLLYWLKEDETIFLLGGHKEIPLSSSQSRQYLPFAINPEDVLNDKALFQNLTLSYQWECEEDRADFLSRYNFLPGKTREILELAKSYSLSEGNGRITADELRYAVLRASSHSLDKYARKIRSIYRMHDLILPEMQKKKLSHIISRIRNRKLVYEEWGFLEKSAYGNGTSMIFAGPPGTGKTMAAQVMAAELGMELYRVELPSVVDKYIGETEKKLNRIFGEAENSMAILFFDEADVLFSKRTEIKESNDKYSNMEIAFLLQKMEEYEGVSILATNYLQNFDSAFRRRVSDIIDFPLPDANLRRQMWQSMIPSKIPISEENEIDFEFLANQFEASGSTIKNALIYAGFLAAEEKEPTLTMERILKGLSHELEKSGKKLSRDEYGEYGHLF